jgi:hypothetical protein
MSLSWPNAARCCVDHLNPFQRHTSGRFGPPRIGAVDPASANQRSLSTHPQKFGRFNVTPETGHSACAITSLVAPHVSAHPHSPRAQATTERLAPSPLLYGIKDIPTYRSTGARVGSTHQIGFLPQTACIASSSRQSPKPLITCRYCA